MQWPSFKSLSIVSYNALGHTDVTTVTREEVTAEVTTVSTSFLITTTEGVGGISKRTIAVIVVLLIIIIFLALCYHNYNYTYVLLSP